MPASDGGGADLIVRAVETRGETVDAVIDVPLVGRVIEAKFSPYRIRTFRVPRTGPIEDLDLLELPWEGSPDHESHDEPSA